MLTPLKGLKLGRRGALIGIVLSAATATAVGAASGHTPWPEPARPTIVASSEPPSGADVTTSATIDTPTEPVVATTVPTPEVSPDDAVAPPTVAPIVPASPAEPPVAPEPTEPVAVKPAPVPEPAPSAAEAPDVEPAIPDATPVPAPASPPHDNVVPSTLSLSCVVSADSPIGPVSCTWSGETPSGFASYVLLRADPDGKGRVPFGSTDAAAGAFVDSTASAGNHSYVLVALDSAAHPLAHSNMVLVQIAAA